MNYRKLIRITTIPGSLNSLIKGQPRFMSENGYHVIGISSPGSILPDIEKNERIKVIPVNMTRTLSPLKDLYSLWRIYWVLKKEKPFIVHTHTPKAGIIGMLASWLAHVPIRLHTVAGLPLMVTKGDKRKLLDYVEKITYACATKVYPNSFGLYNFILKQKYTSKNKLKVIGSGSSNGIDAAYFDTQHYTNLDNEQLRDSLSIDDNDFVFIFIGRMVKDKGLTELVNAFCNINVQRCKLLLVGTYERDLDPLSPSTEKQIEDNPNIIATGYQKDVRPFIAISNALVFPSYREGFPNVVMQAGAMGLPSIVSDINGCNEIIINDKNGITIPPKDEKALLKAMLYFLNNPEPIKLMASKARALILKRYEQKTIWEAILKEYKTLESEYFAKHQSSRPASNG